MDGLAFLGLGAGIVPLALLVLLIVAIAGGRNEPDPGGERPAALYYAAVLFVTLFTAVFAVFGVGASLMKLSTHHDRGDEMGYSSRQSVTIRGDGTERMIPIPSEGPFPGQPLLRGSHRGEHDDDWANALRAGVVAVIAIGVFGFHDQRRRTVRFGPIGDRVRRTFLYAVSFVAVVIFVVAAGVALYAVIQMITPGVTSAGTRADAAVHFGQAGLLALLALFVAQRHLPLADGGTGAGGGGDRASSSSSALLVPEPVPPVLPDEETTTTRAAKKRAPAKKAAPAKKKAKAATKKASPRR